MGEPWSNVRLGSAGDLGVDAASPLSNDAGSFISIVHHLIAAADAVIKEGYNVRLDRQHE